MGVKEIIDSIRGAREKAIQCLAVGEYGYAEAEMRPLYPYMQAEFRTQLVGYFNACNYDSVYDMLEHIWNVVEVPSTEEEAEAAARAAEATP